MHPSSIFLLATLRHEELQDLVAREERARLAMTPGRRQSDSVGKIRVWLGAAMIAAGTRLLGEEPREGLVTVGRLDTVGVS